MILTPYIDALKSGENFLLKRLYLYASESEYTRYTSTKEEDWRMTLKEPARVLIEFLQNHDKPDSIHVDEKFEDNPAAAFGVLEAKRHRERGVRFNMFLGLAKLVRQAFIDLIYEISLTEEERKQALAITHRFFDKFELGFCSEWVRHQENDLLRELQDANRRVTNEKNQYLTIFQAMVEPAFVVDPEMRVVEVNAAFEKFFGISCQEIKGKKCSGVICHHLCESCPLEKAMGESSSFSNIETPISVKSEEKTVLISGSFLDDISGKYAGGIAFLQNITERKRAEEALRESEERFRKAFDHAALGIALVSPTGRLLKVNLYMCQMWGYTEEELLAKTFNDLTHPDDQHIGIEVMQKLLNNTLSFAWVEKRYLHRDGSTIWALLGTSLLRDSAGKPLYLVSHIQDITDQKKAQEQLKLSLQEKEVLLKEIHHRVKNNLQVVSSLFYLPSEYIEDKQSLKILNETRNRVKSMALIHERLYQSKDLARIGFAEYTRKLAADLFHSYGVNQSVITLKVNVDDVLLNVDTAIPCGLIVNELVSNSLKHAFPSGRKGEICIEIRAGEEGKLVLIVGDNGTGFPGDLDFRNTGSMGLRLVNILTAQLNGTIELDRSGGTAFKITFPGIQH